MIHDGQTNQPQTLLEVRNLTKEFQVGGAVQKKARVHAVSDVSFDIRAGETFSLVGESGCGKSTLGRLVLGLIPPTAGSVLFDGTDLTQLRPREMTALRREMQIIFQDPYASLNPRMTIGDIVAEPLRTHKMFRTRAEVSARVRELLLLTGIRPEFMQRYPHQFSGGQRQRVGIARALALNPRLIVCDEPVSALDVSIRSQVLNLLADLQRDLGLTYLFISHDLSVVRYLSDRVCVMFLGRLCECGSTRDIYENPLHPYTRLLLDSVPEPDPSRRKEREFAPGEMPSPIDPPSGCRFRTRCPHAQAICAAEVPVLREIPTDSAATADSGGDTGVSGTRQVACHFPGVCG